MKVAKIIPNTIPILILLREKHKIWCKIGQKTLYLVVLGGYAYTLGGACYIHLTKEPKWIKFILFLFLKLFLKLFIYQKVAIFTCFYHKKH